MIDRVGGQSTYNAAYERSGKKAARIDGDAPAFLLPREDGEGVIWERSSKKEAEKPALRVKKDEYVPAVKLEEPKREAGKQPALEAGEKSGPGLFERIKEALKSFINKLWYGDEAQSGNAGKGSAQRAGAAGQAEDKPESKEERIRRLISAADNDGLYDELTEGGKLKPARNTTLLTYYDRFGRIVKPGDSDAGRILKAERTNERRNIVMRPQGNYRRYV